MAASEPTAYQIKVTWKDNSNNETGFEIDRGTSKTNLTKVTTVKAGVLSYTETPPQANTLYYYAVRSYNSSGKSTTPTPATGSVSRLTAKAPASSSTSVSSTSSTISSTATTKLSGTVTYIGPTRAVKSLDAAHWPAKGQTATFVLDPSSTPYPVSLHFIAGNLTIISADPNKRATLKLPAVFKKNSGGTYIASNPTLSVNGSLTIENINTVGGMDAVLLGSSTTGNIDCEDVDMTDGGALWRGSGGNTILLKNNDIHGRPRANVISNYDHTVNKVTVDNSGTNVPIQQGGVMVNGQPVGEAAIRIMDVNTLALIGVKTLPWLYKSGQEWKQDVQLRPSSNLITVTNCTMYQADVGDMTWRSPARPINEVDFVNCTFTKSPNLTNGVKLMTIKNCRVV